MKGTINMSQIIMKVSLSLNIEGALLFHLRRKKKIKLNPDVLKHISSKLH